MGIQIKYGCSGLGIAIDEKAHKYYLTAYYAKAVKEQAG